MWQFFLTLVNNYGVFGVILINLGLLGFLVYKVGFKLFNNHLKHLEDRFTDQETKLDKIILTQEGFRDKLQEISERVANLEGKNSVSPK